MKIRVLDNYEQMSREAAELVINEVRIKNNAIICFPTGSSPLRMYEILCEECQKGNVDFSKVRVRSVDDYVGLAPDNNQSYYYYLQSLFFSKCNFQPANICLIDSCASNMEEECRRYNDLLKKEGGIDLILDGIGENGHIGFNEPAEFLHDDIHVEDVSEWTAKVNARFFSSVNEVPKQAVTVGILDMLEAKKLIVLSSGIKKAPVWKKIFADRTISTQFPASFLKLANNAYVLMDQASASLLDKHLYTTF
ncbi:Glucosamine-6-phosphate deaminase 1 [bioreactor metagenome]|uniref:Glucosamine-6-phosphate deaminase 1 n=1 Tax=bioreactor metagenome TaxID=1076179 RepID=A0A645AXL8_9ZZZZ|nr:glucosamine-6-phosphate deaminase [Erysipelotrichaceae bacterium]